MARMRNSRPDSGLGVQVKVLKPLSVVKTKRVVVHRVETRPLHTDLPCITGVCLF